MAKGPQRIRGTQDILGEEADRFHKVVETFDRVRRLYAFQRVEIPVFEATEVFARSIASRISRSATARSPQPFICVHFPGSRSL